MSQQHPFASRPHRTLIALTLPALVSQVAVPLTDLADAAFVSRLGSGPAAALGAATAILLGFIWVLFFIAVGTQTEVAQAFGAQDHDTARSATGVALVVALGLGVAAAILLAPFLPELCSLMGAKDEVHEHAVGYLEIRLLGLPAAILMGAAFGAMRGFQDMRTPAWIAVVTNALNIALDPIFIWGLGPLPAWGVSGAAAASVISHWIAVVWALIALRKRIGWTPSKTRFLLRRLFTIGRDMLIRTGVLNLFLILTTRTATTISDDAGAAHLAISRVWSFTAFFLDSFAYATQSLVGYFLGARDISRARQVALVGAQWSLATGLILGVALLACEPIVRRVLVPPEAWVLFATPWLVSAITQPVNSLSFITDGIHWGTGDYPYLRNATLLASAVGITALAFVDVEAESALLQVWLVTVLWISARATLGVLRVWPGVGRAPLAESS